MDTKQQIEIMQAFLDGRTIQFKSNFGTNDWYDFPSESDPTWDWFTYTYRIKPESKLPKTWEEFCETHPVKEGECFISHCHKDNIGQQNVGERERLNDMNFWLPNKQITKAMLALCQLIQLRDCYNQGWKPNWTDGKDKYCITKRGDKLLETINCSCSCILAFETDELCDEFFVNFKELIEATKELI